MATPTFMPPERATTRSSALRNIALISGREYRDQVTQRSFMIISIIYLVLIIGGSFVPTIIQFVNAQAGAQPQTTIALINNAGSVAGMDETALTDYVETTLNGPQEGEALFVVRPETATDLDKMRNDVRDGNLQLLLVIERATNEDVNYTYYTISDDIADSNVIQVQTMANQLSILDRAERLNLSPEQVNSLLAQPQFTITNLQQVQDGRSGADIVTGIILAYVGTILIYMSIMTYGMSVAQGVAQEKGSRIMEILMLAATPFQLMVGKIIGIGAAGLTQMGSLVLVGIGALAIQFPLQSLLLGSAASDPAVGLLSSVTSASVGFLLLLLLYFILAFAFYSSLMAAAGAMIQRQEEASSAGMPVVMLLMVGYIVSVALAPVPGVADANWFVAMSYVPLWSPTMMLVRVAMGTVAWWEIVLTVVLMLIAIPACAWISSRIYRSGILLYGQRFNLFQFIKLVGSK